MNVFGILMAVSAAANGPVTSVVVYPDRAQVVRTGQVTCGPRALMTFQEVSPAADPQSFRARSSAGTVEGLRWVERTREEAYAPALKDIDLQLEELARQIAAQQAIQARASNQTRVAQQLEQTTVQFASRDLAVAPNGSKTWLAGMDSAMAVKLKAAAATQDAATKLRALEQRRAELLRRRQIVGSTPHRKDFTVEVLVSCASGTANVDLTYLAGGASWEPAYELRADEGGGVELAMLATVRQSTGEPWKDARLALSTAVPRQNATPPEVQQLNVFAQERQEQKKVLVRRDERVEHAQAAGAPAGGEGGGRLAAEDQGLSVQLKVPEAVDVSPDGTPVKLQVGTHKLKAQWSMRAAPKLQPYVFRVAELVNTAPFPLLEGSLGVFHKNGFIGTFPLERVPQGGKFTVTFGVEDGLRVKRIVVQEVARDTGFLGSVRRFNYAYRFEVKGFRTAAQEVQLSEHVPVSEMDDVRVEIDPKTTKGYELDKADGIVTWKVKLAKGDSKDVDLVFHVDVPSSYDTGNL